MILYTYMTLAKAVFRRDILQGALGPSLSSLFRGKLRVTVEGGEDDSCYTYLKKVGWAVIHLGYGFPCQVHRVHPNSSVPPESVREIAKKFKTSMEGAAYHECSHLLYTDMTGKAFESIATKYIPFLETIKRISNLLEDPSMEHHIAKKPYYRFMKPYFLYNVKRLFIPQGNTYKDNGSFEALCQYIFLYLRIGPNAIKSKNAKFEELKAKGIVEKLRSAYRDKNPITRCQKQVEFAEWLIDEYGLKPNDQPPAEAHERPVIIIKDGKSNRSKPLQPQDAPLPPVSIAQASKRGKGNAPSIDADIIDARKEKSNKKDGSNGSGASKSSGAGDDEGDAFDWEKKGDSGQLGDQDDRLDTAYDPDLDEALRTDAEAANNATCVKAEDSYDMASAGRAEIIYQSCLQETFAESMRLSRSIEDVKEDSAPYELHHLTDGEEFSVEDYIDSVCSGDQTLEAYTSMIEGREITDLAVSLLVDCSGSMKDDRCRVAFRAACVAVSACERAEVPIEVCAFSSGGILVLKAFEDKVDPKKMGLLLYSIKTDYKQFTPKIVTLWGGTDLAGALPLLFSRLRKYTGKAYKLAFIITDGDTNNNDKVHSLVEAERKSGTLVIGIGIGVFMTKLMQCFDQCRSFNSYNLGEMPKYIADEIRKAMSSPSLGNL